MGQGQMCGMMVDRAPALALTHLRPVLRLVGPAQPVIGIGNPGAVIAAFQPRDRMTDILR
jgi:hypothetical protein